MRWQGIELLNLKYLQNMNNEQNVEGLTVSPNDAKPLVSSRFSSMTRDEAIQYCYQHKDEYIRDFDSISEGVRQFDCLIAILKYGTIQPTDLPQYGMDY